MKIFVAIPTYDAKLPIEIVRCLLGEQLIAYQFGDELSFRFLSGDAGIAGARNQLVQEFLNEEFDRLFFLDADIVFEPGHLVKLCHMPVDFCGGAYPHKFAPEAYPLELLQGALWTNSFGLIEVAKLPTGFLSLSRKVFEVLKEKFPERGYSHYDNVAHCYFQIKMQDGVFYGEDYLFCKEWIDAGGKIYLDPEIPLTHLNFRPTKHVGHIGNWLKKTYSQNQDTEKSVSIDSTETKIEPQLIQGSQTP